MTGVEHSKSLFTDLKKIENYIGIIGGKLGKSSQLFPNEQTKSRMKKNDETVSHKATSGVESIQVKHGSIQMNPTRVNKIQ